MGEVEALAVVVFGQACLIVWYGANIRKLKNDVSILKDIYKA